MTPATNVNKQLITSYLNALSGHAKTPELIALYASDPHLLKHIEDVEAAFPCYELAAQDMICEGGMVAVRATFSGVHLGPFAGIAATNKRVSAGLIIIYRIADERIAEHWLQLDTLALLEQLKTAPVAVGA